MAYIGHSASGNFTTKPSKDTFSGDGSTTAFTLSEGATTNTVDVFVENVRQEPTTAYTVDGTTLTFTAAPGSGTNNIYVVNRGPLQLSATHPAAQALEASTGTFTGDLTIPSINGGQIGGRRNLIVNGGMQVSQRGTSETGVGAVIKYANAPDRVKYVSLNSAGTHQYTISQSTTTPDGFSHSYKLDCTTADTSLASDVAVFLSVSPMEGQNLQHLQYGTSGAKSVTLSFHVRSNKTGTYVIELYSPDTGKHIAKTYTIDSADTWEKKTLTFVGDTASALDNDNARSLEVLVWLGAGSNYNSGTLPATWATLVNANRCVGQTVNLADNTANEFFITGIQLEVGSVATEFEHRSFGEELALCQRYFQKSYNQNVALGTVTNTGITVGVRGNGAFSMTAHLKQTMRATPTAVAYSPVTGASGKVRDLEGGDDENATITASESTIHFTGTGGNIPNAYSVHHTADAEL